MSLLKGGRNSAYMIGSSTRISQSSYCFPILGLAADTCFEALHEFTVCVVESVDVSFQIVQSAAKL